MKLVECVPNISEGRNQAAIAEISEVVRNTAGVRLLDVDPGAETNRTVFTFVGEGPAVVEAAFRLIQRTQQLVDMRNHRGAHARLGATDVCPFVPVGETTMEECVVLARQLGERVARELGLPVYLYEAAATSAARRSLPDVRKGEYEGLKAKLGDGAWKPDFGPRVWSDTIAKGGACIIGARPFLIAYNVNLNTKDKKLANEIAFTIRESGRPKKDDKGQVVLDAHGQKVMIPGTLKAVKATGWVIEQYQCAQVSINLTDYHQTPLGVLFDEVEKQARERGVRVTGSELVGLIPEQALLDAGRHFLTKMKRPDGVPESELLTTAIRSLGLTELAPFDAQKKVIEYSIAEPTPLASMTVKQFVSELASDSAAPGGGSASALCGALSAALVGMVSSLSLHKSLTGLADVGRRAQVLKTRLCEAIDQDSAAFNLVLAAMRLPKATPEEQTAREQAMETAQQGATTVPLSVMRLGCEATELAVKAVEQGYAPSLSDAGVAALAGLVAVEGAYLNVRANLPTVNDDAFKQRVSRESEELLNKARAAAKTAAAGVTQRLSAPPHS